ncbi:hypothetical protein C0J50_8848 [Silurus asotus]|uniref:Uncharacterized protein n=1 Tax=Silurus asotus TaxID=30991 RepID=A0AAD5AE11_SILAS|nr:hypothetical protein C0J50_8848 [Silurus asotus]
MTISNKHLPLNNKRSSTSSLTLSPGKNRYSGDDSQLPETAAEAADCILFQLSNC